MATIKFAFECRGMNEIMEEYRAIASEANTVYERLKEELDRRDLVMTVGDDPPLLVKAPKVS